MLLFRYICLPLLKNLLYQYNLINMKRITILVLVIGLISILSSCQSDSKADTWTADQEQTWKTNCQQLLVANGTTEADAEGFCDCMFKKTAEKYTPEEAAQITEEEEQKIWQECDYQW